MPTKTTVYCHYSEQQVRESGLLSPTRMTEVSAAIDVRITPCFNATGQQVKNAFIADQGEAGSFIYARCDTEHTVEYMRRSCLPAVLTPQELELINNHCLSARATRLNQERFAKATKVDKWDGGAWLDDQYFHSMEELCDHLVCMDEEWPEYVWAAKPHTVIDNLDVAQIVADSIDNCGWEGMETGDLHGVAELQAALDKFTVVNSSVVSYHVDYSTAILLASWRNSDAQDPKANSPV